MTDVVHISFAKITAPCPYCLHEFDDKDDSIVNACNKNKSGITRRFCKNCKSQVGLTYNYRSELVAFRLTGPYRVENRYNKFYRP